MAGKWLLEGRRSSIQIIADILSIARFSPACKTDIMIEAKVNYRQINDYLTWLTDLRLIETTTNADNQNRFRTTRKGQQLLSTIKKIQAMLN